MTEVLDWVRTHCPGHWAAKGSLPRIKRMRASRAIGLMINLNRGVTLRPHTQRPEIWFLSGSSSVTGADETQEIRMWIVLVMPKEIAAGAASRCRADLRGLAHR